MACPECGSTDVDDVTAPGRAHIIIGIECRACGRTA